MGRFVELLSGESTQCCPYDLDTTGCFVLGDLIFQDAEHPLVNFEWHKVKYVLHLRVRTNQCLFQPCKHTLYLRLEWT